MIAGIENNLKLDKIMDEKRFLDALAYHANGKPGKLEIRPTTPLDTQNDLALAYSPGVAAPCLKIKEDHNAAYTYTNKGNMVAVISNGTAVLGLGNIGAQASKPVMEGKAVLFKKFADIDSIDLEVDTEDPETFINVVKYLSPSFGGINLEDIKAPECFEIEERLKAEMNIPVFHDDQHGTAICVLAGLINACDLTNRSLDKIKIVVNGAGAGALACIKLLVTGGVSKNNIIIVDRTGVVYKGRPNGMNKYKEEWAQETPHRTLAEAVVGADVLIGLSAKDAFTVDMVRSMKAAPIVFAMANPHPEILPEIVKKHIPNAIVATGRSDYPNQINNVLCFPFLFRGTLDCRAREINDDMKCAAAYAISKLAKEPVPSSILKAYQKDHMEFGPDYILPVPLDPRLKHIVAPAVVAAAMKTGAARVPIENLTAYQKDLELA